MMLRAHDIPPLLLTPIWIHRHGVCGDVVCNRSLTQGAFSQLLLSK